MTKCVQHSVNEMYVVTMHVNRIISQFLYFNTGTGIIKIQNLSITE